MSGEQSRGTRVLKLEADASREATAVFEAQHQREEWEVVEAGEEGVKAGFCTNDYHASAGEGEVEHSYSRKEEE